MTEPAIRLATAADTPAILALIDASYDRPDAPERLAYWRWKHEANPFGTSPCLVAESAGGIVGVRAFLRWTWRAGARRVAAVRAVDTATHPSWQGRGIFSRLTMRLVDDMRREGVSFIYNTPNSQSMPGYLKMGWTLVARIPLWIRPLTWLDPLRRVVGRTAAAAPALGHVPAAADALNDARLPAFLQVASPGDDRYHTDRTLAFLRWRYAAVPGLSYKAHLDIDGDAGALVIVRSRVRGRLREVTICDLLMTPTRRGIAMARRLVSTLAARADADYIAACAPRGTAERRVLARSGFLPAPRLGPHFTARRLDQSAPDPSRWGNWRCSIGDLELF
jgi:GNAT superfamily N-acetyltransferase